MAVIKVMDCHTNRWVTQERLAFRGQGRVTVVVFTVRSTEMKVHHAVVCAMVAILAAAPAVAQKPRDENARYTKSPDAKVDPNFGLPTFGMPGADIPRQSMAAPPRSADATPVGPAQPGSADGAPDFFKRPPGGSTGFADFASPATRRPTSGGGAWPAADDASSTSANDTTSSITDDTSLYTTSQGVTTGDTSSAFTTK